MVRWAIGQRAFRETHPARADASKKPSLRGLTFCEPALLGRRPVDQDLELAPAVLLANLVRFGFRAHHRREKTPALLGLPTVDDHDPLLGLDDRV